MIATRPTGFSLFVLLVVIVIMTVIVPQQEQIAKELAIALPAISENTINASRFIGSYWWTLIPLAAPYLLVAWLFARQAQNHGASMAI